MNRAHAILAAIGLGTAIAASPVSAATEIRASVGVPQKHPVGTPGYAGYAEAVEKESKGQIKFQLFWGGQLLGLRNTVKGLKDGVADVAMVATAYYPAEFPNGKMISDFALVGRGSVPMAGAVTEFHQLHCADCLAEYDTQNILFTGAYSTDVYQLLGTKKITSLDDLKGKKIRTGGANWTRWLNAVGAVPVNLTGDDVYQALSNGAIDASVASMAHLKAFSLADVVTHATLLPLGTFHATDVFAYRKDFWKELAEADRRLLLKHVPKALVDTTLAYVAEAESVVPPAKQKGIQFHEPNDALRKMTTDFALKDLEIVAAEATKFGVKDASTKVAKFLALLKKWEDLAAPLANDGNRITTAFQTEIFDKMNAARFGM